ncbi:MAG: MATE family efflux transporter, partial [Lachnospiraceae bacterium]|nr:MATE family efflux transporter [Lachnospiraceae bacterium]
MEKQAVYSMTEGSPARLLLKFTIPMLIGNLFQQFYNMVDSIVVGRFVGANALAAVGATGSLNFLLFAMSFGISAGVGVVVSQYFGAGSMDMV